MFYRYGEISRNILYIYFATSREHVITTAMREFNDREWNRMERLVAHSFCIHVIKMNITLVGAVNLYEHNGGRFFARNF